VTVDETVATDNTATRFGRCVTADIVEFENDASACRIEHHHGTISDPWSLGLEADHKWGRLAIDFDPGVSRLIDDVVFDHHSRNDSA
jgi:hypothetical protein